MDSSLPSSLVHGISSVRILEFLFPSSGDFPDPGIEPVTPELQILYHWTTRKPLLGHENLLNTPPRDASQVVLVVKNLSANEGDIRDVSLIPGLEKSPGKGNDNPLQYSCLGNPMDQGAWWATYSPWGHKESDMTKAT